MKDESLEIISTYNNIDKDEKKEFISNLRSDTFMQSSLHKVEFDYSWLDLMEDVCKYIDNIVREPKRFIVNDEEIVKVEKSKKVTVESVIHLTQHTNFINKYDQTTGMVTPSKILNILKEDTLDTYENRFIYTLILRMLDFIERYGMKGIDGSSLNASKDLNYTARTKKGGDEIKIELKLNASNKKDLSMKKNGATIKSRVLQVKEKVMSFTGSQLFKDLAHAHVPLTKSPLKKTNLILKNPNFQRAEAMWNFLDTYDDNIKHEERNTNNYSGNQNLKNNLDFSFLLNYSILEKITKDGSGEIDWDEINLNILKNALRTYINYDPYIDETKLMKMIKNEVTNLKKEQQNKFKSIRTIIEKDLEQYNKNLIEAKSIIK